MSADSMEARLRELEDLEAIRDLARRYAHCVWQKDIPGAVELFAEDGEMDTGERDAIRGREALMASYQEMVGDAQFQPFVHNHVIELSGNEATGTCYLDLRSTSEGRSMIGSGYYEDRYTRRDDGWKFQSRKLILSYLVPLAEGWAESAETQNP